MPLISDIGLEASLANWPAFSIFSSFTSFPNKNSEISLTYIGVGATDANETFTSSNLSPAELS